MPSSVAQHAGVDCPTRLGGTARSVPTTAMDQSGGLALFRSFWYGPYNILAFMSGAACYKACCVSRPSRKTRQDGIDWWKSRCFQCWRRGGSKERKSRSGKRRKRRAKQGTTRQNQGWVEQGTLGKASLVQESKKQKQEDQERWQ